MNRNYNNSKYYSNETERDFYNNHPQRKGFRFIRKGVVLTGLCLSLFGYSAFITNKYSDVKSNLISIDNKLEEKDAKIASLESNLGSSTQIIAKKDKDIESLKVALEQYKTIQSELDKVKKELDTQKTKKVEKKDKKTETTTVTEKKKNKMILAKKN